MSVKYSVPWFVICGMLAPRGIQAGTITLTETARVSHPVELISVSVAVEHQCFPNQDEVLKVSQGVGARITEVMKKHSNAAADSLDRIFAAPGFTSRKSVTRVDHATNRSVVVCENLWAANNNFTLHLANYQQWSELQADLLTVADSYLASEVKPASTTLTISEPSPMLYPETRRNLYKKARLQALELVSQQFASIAELCQLRNARITAINPLEASPKLAFAARRSGGDDGSDDTFTPVYDALYMTAGWQVTYRFIDAGSGCSTPRT